MISALSLDIWGTLLRSDPEFKPARNGLLRAAFAPSVAPAVFDAAMRRADRDADEVSLDRGRDVGFVERVTLAVSRLAEHGHPGDFGDRGGLRLDAGAVEAVEARSGELMDQQAQLALRHPPKPLHPDLPAVVATLAERMPVVLTSNTGMLPGVLMRRLLPLAGFTGLPGVFSDETGWAKPHPQIFAASLALAGRPARDVLHVGDNPRADVEGARAAGLRAVLVAPDGHATRAVLTGLLEPVS